MPEPNDESPAEPHWHVHDTIRATGETEEGQPDDYAFKIVWDPEVVNPEDYAKLITAIGDLVRACGGIGIERVSSRLVEVRKAVK